MHRRLLALTRHTRFLLILTVLSGFLAGLLVIGQAWLLSGTVNDVFLEGKTLEQVWPGLRLFLLVIAARALLTWLNELSASTIAVRLKALLRRNLLEHLFRLGPAYVRGERSGEIAQTVAESVEALDAYYGQYLPQLIITALLPTSILLFVFPLDPLSGVILLVTAPLIPLFMVLIGKGAEIVTRRQYETLSLLSAHFLDSLQGLTTLKIFGRARAHRESIADVSERYREVTLQVLRVTFLSAFALELLATISTAIIAVEIGLRLLYGRMEFREAFFFLILAPEFYMPLRALGARFHAGMAGSTAARRIFEILDRTETLSAHDPTLPATSGPTPSPATIHLEGVTFRYPDEPQATLRNLNLTLHHGQRVALVGKSGAGKTTLAALLLGFLKPSEGRIFWREASGGEHEGPPPLSQIAWVSQRPYLLHDTVEANLRLARPNATQAELEAAARAAHLHEFILSLPQGYQTVIGEGGARLSGGQAQRLAIARAFLKDAPILILDEPTSGLDPETESLLEDSLRRLMAGKTVLIIAHRLNTVYTADRILVLEEGEIVEDGTHEQLRRRGGLYAQMIASARLASLDLEPRGGAPEASAAPMLREEAPAAPGPLPIAAPPRGTSVLLRLLGFLRGSERWVALSVLLGALTIGASISLMGTSSWLIAMAALHPTIAELNLAIVGVRFFGIARAVFRYLERLVSHNVTFRLLARLRVWFYEHLEPLAPARLLEYRAGDLLARIVADVQTLENFYVRVVSPPLTALLVLIGTAVFLAAYGVQLAVALIVSFLLAGLILPIVMRLASRAAGQAWVRLRAQLHADLVDNVQGMADLIAFEQAPARLRLFDGLQRRYNRAQLRLASLNALQSGAMLFLTNLGLWLVIYLAIPEVSAGRIPGIMLGALGLLTLAAFEAVQPLPQTAQMWESIRQAAQRLFEIVDTQPAVIEEGATELPPGPPSLSFEHVSFTYPGTSTPALQDVSFTLSPGRKIAIVGPSGAGKSTLVYLLLRFWDYQQGEIRLNGVPIRTLHPDLVRAQFAVVGQNSYFFNATVRQNLRLARLEATDAEMEAAARQARIHEVLAALPQGYRTRLGEQGARLSGGERQRLALARALLRQAPIFLLDEPTANLDTITEREVLETLFEALRDRTVLLITHRLIGLENMDEILVLDKGRIVERGTHAELLSQGGLYRHLWEAQNRILVEEEA
ncbi:MAG: thiol reductant ABC exporter subunit CydD [Anaerolineales bacterium]